MLRSIVETFRWDFLRAPLMIYRGGGDGGAKLPYPTIAKIWTKP